MRIVFDITTPQQVSGGGRPYANLPGKQGFSSAQIEILICESPAANHPELTPGMFHEDYHPAIHIEGDSKYIKRALRDALSVIDAQEDYMEKTLGAVRNSGCPKNYKGIEENNGTHAITCKRHPNYQHFKKEAAKKKAKK